MDYGPPQLVQAHHRFAINFCKTAHNRNLHSCFLIWSCLRSEVGDEMEQRNCRQSFSEQMQCILGHQSTWNKHVFYILTSMNFPHILSLGMHYMINLTSCTPEFFLFKSEEASEWRLTQTSIYFEANSDADAQNLRTVIKRTMFRSAQWSVSLFHLFSPRLLSSSFIPLLNPIRPGTRAAELCLHRLQLDTHTHSLHTIICIHVFHTHTHTHSEHFIHCLRLIFFPHLFESRPLRVHTNADLETQKIRHLNSDWRETHPSEWGNLVEKRQHTFLRDGRQALEGKLNLSKDAVGGIEKRLSFCVVQRAPFTHPQIFFLYMFLFMVHSLKFSSRGGENWAEDVCLELQVRIFRMDGWGDEEAPHSNLLLKKIFKCL